MASEDGQITKRESAQILAMSVPTFDRRLKSLDFPRFPRPRDNGRWSLDELNRYRRTFRHEGGIAVSLFDLPVAIPLSWGRIREAMAKLSADRELEDMDVDFYEGQSVFDSKTISKLRGAVRDVLPAHEAFVTFRKEKALRHLGDAGLMTDAEAELTFIIIDFLDKVRSTVEKRRKRLPDLPESAKRPASRDRFRRAAFEFVGAGHPLMIHEAAITNLLVDGLAAVIAALKKRSG